MKRTLRILEWNSLDPSERRAALARPELNSRAELNRVALGVIDQVRSEGDKAVLSFTQMFDGVELSALAVSPDEFAAAREVVTPDQIAAALPGAPGGNGNALNLAALANGKNLSNYTFAQFYGNLGGRVGRDLSTATENQSTKQQLLSQAQAMRQQASGVSLDQEAENLIAFQRSYQANAKMLTVLSSLTDTLMGLIGTAPTM